jgi:hypothetical protein
LPGGQRADHKEALALLGSIPTGVLIAGKGYDVTYILEGTRGGRRQSASVLNINTLNKSKLLLTIMKKSYSFYCS